MARSDPGLNRKPSDEDIDVFGLTHQGNVRSNNNDHFLYCSLRKHIELLGTSLPEPGRLPQSGERLAYLGLVADGVGGGSAGEVASRTATEALYDYVAHSLRCYYTADPQHETGFLATLHRGVMLAHERVVEAAAGDGTPGRMATTMSLVIMVWPRAYVVQVGDSRCYRWRDGGIERITRDQTVAEAMREAGALTTTEAERSPMKHVLTSALGGSEDSKANPVTSVFDVEWGDVMLLCSDGLTGHVKDGEIAEVLSRDETAKDKCRTLLDMALERGGSDNITILVGQTR